MKKLHNNSYFAYIIDQNIYKRVISHEELPNKYNHIIEIGFYAYIGWALQHISNLTSEKLYNTYLPEDTTETVILKHIFEEFKYLKQIKNKVKKFNKEYGLKLVIDKKKLAYFRNYIKFCKRRIIAKLRFFPYIKIWFKLLFI